MLSSVIVFAGVVAFFVVGYLLIQVWMPKGKSAPRSAHQVPAWRERPRNVDHATGSKARQWWRNG